MSMDDILQQMLQTEKEASACVQKATEDANEIRRNGRLMMDSKQKEWERESHQMARAIIDEAIQKATTERQKSLQNADLIIEKHCMVIQEGLEKLLPDFLSLISGKTP